MGLGCGEGGAPPGPHLPCWRLSCGCHSQGRWLPSACTLLSAWLVYPKLDASIELSSQASPVRPSVRPLCAGVGLVPRPARQPEDRRQRHRRARGPQEGALRRAAYCGWGWLRLWHAGWAEGAPAGPQRCGTMLRLGARGGGSSSIWAGLLRDAIMQKLGRLTTPSFSPTGHPTRRSASRRRR